MPSYWTAVDWTGHVFAAADAEVCTEREFRRRRRGVPCQIERISGPDAGVYIRDSMRRWKLIDDELMAIAAGSDPFRLARRLLLSPLAIATLAAERKARRDQTDRK